jgi:hypothetical protein
MAVNPRSMLVPRAPYVSERLSRWRISLPVLKYGTAFFSTETVTPVRGLWPMRAGRRLTEKVPNPRSSTRSPRVRAAMISPKMDVHDLVYVKMIEVSVLLGNALQHLRLDHRRHLRPSYALPPLIERRTFL